MVREYVGARYVVKFADNAWDAATVYEPLTVVQYGQDWFTSKKPVPAGLSSPPNNSEYWARTGNYNGQVEQYRQDVAQLEADFDTLGDDVAAFKVEVNATVDKAKTDLNNTLNEATDALDKKVDTATEQMESTVAQAKSDLNDTLEAAEAELNTKLTDATTAMNETVEATKSQLETTTAELNKSISDANAALESTKTELDAAIEQANENASKIKTDIDTRVDGLDDDLTALTGRVTTAEGNITTLQGDVTELQENATTDEANIKSNGDAIEALTGRVTTAEGNITANKNSIDELNEKVGTARERNLLLLGDIWTTDQNATLFTKLKSYFNSGYNYGATGASMTDVGDQAETAANTIDAETITDVYIVGGEIDASRETASTQTDLYNSFAKVVSTFPNASVHYFPNANYYAMNRKRGRYGTIIFAAMQAGVITHPNVIALSFARNGAYYNSDDYGLLTVAGYTVMAYYYYLYANGGKTGKSISWNPTLTGSSTTSGAALTVSTATITVDADTGRGEIDAKGTLSFTIDADNTKRGAAITISSSNTAAVPGVIFTGGAYSYYSLIPISDTAYTDGCTIATSTTDDDTSKITGTISFGTVSQGSYTTTVTLHGEIPDPLGVMETEQW